MTKSMEYMRNEIFRAIFNFFPEDYIDIVFTGDVGITDFVNEILIYFINYSFEYCQEKHSLRYYVPYGVDENCDERMKYCRMIAYSHKYKNQRYNELKAKGFKCDGLKVKKIKSMQEKKGGYDLTPMRFFELETLHDMVALKAFVEGRIMNVKKVSNTNFISMMSEYDKYVEKWAEKRKADDYSMVFYSLAFFTIDWKYGFEFAYLLAKKMEELKIKEIDEKFFTLYCAQMTIQSWLGCCVFTDSIMIKVRQSMIDILFTDDLIQSNEIEFYQRCYAELLVIMSKLITNQSLRQYFLENTTMEDWASFFREYDMFAAWHRKELNNIRIRNMRNIMKQMHK